MRIQMTEKTFDDKLAEEILSVQPMDEAGKALAELYRLAKTEDELKSEGYVPVSHLGLMWVKK